MSFAPAQTTEPDPPFYILLQHAQGGLQTVPSTASNFVHPVIEYHFADDPPSALLPTSDAEAVVIIDYEGPGFPPSARSLHPELAIAGMKITDAPGAAAAHPRRNDRMYVLETIPSGDVGYVRPCSSQRMHIGLL